jgi:DNA repair protein RadC
LAHYEVAALATEILAHQDQEVVLVFLLDTKNAITGYIEVARGTLDACALHPDARVSPAAVFVRQT